MLIRVKSRLAPFLQTDHQHSILKKSGMESNPHLVEHIKIVQDFPGTQHYCC